MDFGQITISIGSHAWTFQGIAAIAVALLISVPFVYGAYRIAFG